MFLLFDYVHLFKCIRNNWITEKTQELEFVYEGEMKRAKWSDIKALYNLEKTQLIKSSKLTEVAVNPKPEWKGKGYLLVSKYFVITLYPP